MKIKKAALNVKSQCIQIETNNGLKFSYPLSKLNRGALTVTPIKVEIDKELGSEAVLIFFDDGSEDALHIDAFLEANNDPEYFKRLIVYRMSLRAQEIIKTSKMGTRAIARKMHTSPAQIYRLLDQTFYGKTVDQMLKLLICLGDKEPMDCFQKPEVSKQSSISPEVRRVSADPSEVGDPVFLLERFKYLNREEIEDGRSNRVFKGIYPTPGYLH